MELEIKTFIDSIGCIEYNKGLSSENYFKFPETKTLIAVKVSRSLRSFFGIGKKIIDIANRNEDPFFLVLLISDKSGWVYSKSEVNSNIKNGFWKLATGDQYKINKGELSDSNYFISHSVFLKKVYQRGGEGDSV